MLFEAIHEEKGIYYQLHGAVTGNDIEQMTIDIYGDPRFDDLRYVILDFLSVN